MIFDEYSQYMDFFGESSSEILKNYFKNHMINHYRLIILFDNKMKSSAS